VSDFIEVYKHAFSPEFCSGLIDFFKWSKENNKTWRRTEASGNAKNDEACCLNPTNNHEINFTSSNLAGYIREFNEVFWDRCYTEYRTKYDTLNSFGAHTIFSYKLQETHPTEGYHIWHAEQDCVEHSRRIAAYIVYLNDVVEGGETEFLYQSKRVPPSEGTLVIFPSSYTHTHRGNPPLSGTKYILTGWVEFS
jgi:hypothetical protein